MAGATTFAFRAMDVAGLCLGGRARGRVEGAGLRAAAPARPDRPRRHREARAVQDRGPVQEMAERRHARAGGLLAPVRDPGRLGDADAAHPAHARGADPGREDQRGRRRRPRRRRGRQLARAGDGAPPEGLRPPLPGDGPLRRAVGPPGGRARPDRLPGRESRRPAPPGQIGADVPGAGLRLRGRRPGRDRRLRDPGLRRHLQRTRRRTPRRSRRPADPDPDLRATPRTCSPGTGTS